MGQENEGVFSEFNFEEDMAINPDELDIAALEQANLAFKYSKETAFYERLAKKAWENTKTVKARLIKDANDDPDACLGKGVKATATNVESYYRGNSEYQDAKDAQIQAEYERDLVKAAADHIAFQRKNMITVLAQLLQNEYYAAPRIPRDLKQEWDGYRKNRREKGEEAATQGISRNRRTRSAE